MSICIHAIENILCLQNETITQARALGEFTMHEITSDADIVNTCYNADIIVTKKKKISLDVVHALPQLKGIITLSAGHEHVPYMDITTLPICNAPTHNSQAVAEHAWSLALGVARRVVEADNTIRNGVWRHNAYDYEGVELTGKTLGLVGYGRIGKRIAMIAEGFGMTTLISRSRTPQAERDHMYRHADVIMICAPHNKYTHHMINKNVISMLKPSAIIVNTSRGALIDTDALYDALIACQIGGAGLDVIEDEPYEGAITSRIKQFVDLPNVILTPHIGYNTSDANKRLGDEMIAVIKSIIAGSPINVVNKYIPVDTTLHSSHMSHTLHSVV